MEGYLLGFQNDKQAQLWYCVLEHGRLMCYDKVEGEIVEIIPLTRHRIRVVNGLEGICPNRFVITAVEMTHDETSGKFKIANPIEKLYHFAAPTSERMRRWSRTIHNWHRHSFDDPVHALTTGRNAIKPHEDVNNARRTILTREKEQLLYFASAFDFHLKQKQRRTSVGSKQESNHRSRLSLPARPKLVSWFSTRLQPWRRTYSTSTRVIGNHSLN